MIQLENKDLKPFREKLAKEQDLICPICGMKRELSEFVVDHQHKTKNEKNGENGAGMVRGVICKYCNSAEGMMLKVFKRSGLYGCISYSEFLSNLGRYLQQPPTEFIHPSEKIKPEKLGKRLFNKLKKEYSKKYPKRKPLEYPKSGKITKNIELLLEEFDLR
jgi:hypothetical protein